MPVHDWTRVNDGTFHDFHHTWIADIKRALNAGLLPDDYYAMAEQQAAGFGPDVLTLQEREGEGGAARSHSSPSGGGLVVPTPKAGVVAETDMAFYRRKQK